MNGKEANALSLEVGTKSNKYQLVFVTLLMSFFSNSLFRTEEHLQLYIIISIVIGAYAVIKLLCNPNRIAKTIYNGFSTWTILLFTMYFFYGLAMPSYYFFNTKYFIFILVMTFITLMLLIDIGHQNIINIFIKVCTISSIAIVLFILVNEWNLILSGGVRIGDSGSGNVITVANYVGLMSIPIMYKFIYEREKKYLIPYGLILILVLLSGSKQSLILLLASLIILTMLKNGIRLYKYILPVFFIALIMFLVVTNDYLYNIIGHRFVDFLGVLGFKLENASSSYSTSRRLILLKVGWDAFKSKPIFGGGWYYFAHFSGLDTYAHNTYLQILSTYGLLGFGVYYSMYIKLICKLYKFAKFDDHAKILLTLLLCILIIDFTAITFYVYVINYQVLVISYLYIKKGFSMPQTR